LFTQGHRTLERSPSGLGIGLFLVRTIVDLHGGSVQVASAGAGSGSTFTVSLPRVSRPLPPASEPARAAALGRSILIIEDDADANELMTMLLEMGGHTVTSCFDGASGLSAVLASDFDIVLCDLALPGLNGFEVIAGLKGERRGRAPLVIATTGYSDPVQLDLARAAGFDRYLVKPVDVDALLGIIAAHC
jgi:CheY-like chemotaxis protein